MPTRRGWAVAAGAMTLLVAGRVFGIFEMFVLGTGAAGLVVAGAVTVLRRRVDLDATRSVRPSRIHVGADSRVELVVTNRGHRASPVIAVRDTLALQPGSTGDGGSPRQPDGARPGSFLLPSDPAVRTRPATASPLNAAGSSPSGRCRPRWATPSDCGRG